MFERPNLDPKFNAKYREENQLSSLPFLEKSRYNLMLKRLHFTVVYTFMISDQYLLQKFRFGQIKKSAIV